MKFFSALHQTQMRLRPPKKISTPYGGRISFIMPGKNRLMIHLKDKQKIRVRKRWSQVSSIFILIQICNSPVQMKLFKFIFCYLNSGYDINRLHIFFFQFL